jgi:hypothetical protein
VLAQPILPDALIFALLEPVNLIRTDRKAEKNCRLNTINFIPNPDNTGPVFTNRILQLNIK